MAELKPCPFCGEKDDIRHEQIVIGRHWYQCGKCGAAPAMLRTRSIEEAAEAWNRRAEEVAQDE